MTGTLRFRNLDVSPQDPVEQWPVEAIATALDRGELPDWHRLSLSIEAAPYGEVARRVEEALELVDSLGVTSVDLYERKGDAERRHGVAHARQSGQRLPGWADGILSPLLSSYVCVS